MHQEGRHPCSRLGSRAPDQLSVEGSQLVSWLGLTWDPYHLSCPVFSQLSCTCLSQEPMACAASWGLSCLRAIHLGVGPAWNLEG